MGSIIDVWNDRWPELTKRSVIANARQLHKRKGTTDGVRDALKALGVRMESLSWQEMHPEGEVGTVSFELWINENFNPDSAVMLDDEMVRDITQTINKNKRLSVHYTLTLGIEVLSPFGTATSAQLASQTLMIAQHRHTTINAGTINSGLAMTAQAATHTTIESLAASIAINAGRVGLALVVTSQLTTITKIYMKDAA